MRSGSYERQTTPPSPLWLTNWCEEGEGVNQTFMRPSRRRPFVHKVSPPPVRLFPFSFFFIFGGKPHPINNEERARCGNDEVGNERLDAILKLVDSHSIFKEITVRI